MKTTKLISQILFVSLFFVLTNGCKKKEEENPIPELTTKAATYVSHKGAFCGGTFTAEANNSTAQGLCWGTSANPTTSDNHSEEMYGSSATGGGTFDVIISNLQPGTTYHVRAYCTNETGTGYGNDISFTTLAAPPATITDVDGNSYSTVVIGNQTWLAKNLNTIHYVNGDPITLSPDVVTANSLTTETYLNVLDNAANASTFGRLYNYYVVVDARKIAPAGWHVPSQDEWDFLIKALGGNNFTMGGKLKETGTTHWNSPNTGADNTSGFTALPTDLNNITLLGNSGSFWSSTIYNDGSNSSVWSHKLVYDDTKLQVWNSGKSSCMSIRLVRDYAQ